MTYYNDNAPYAAEWLSNLIKAGLITEGMIDARSIEDVSHGLDHYRRCHFFAGMGGWELALGLAGWPANKPVWTGSCPCQPFSVAGKRKGTADDRHLWPEWFRLISKYHPPTIFGEQVASKDGREWLSGVFADLESVGYAVAGADLCAAGVGAPHIRQRLYWMAVSDGGFSRNRDVQRSREYGQQPQDGEVAGWMDDSTSSRWQSKRIGPEGEARHETRLCGPESGCIVGRLAHAERDSRDARRLADESRKGNGASATGARDELGRCGDLNRMGDSYNERLQGRSLNIGEYTNQRSAWAPSELIPCLDGKTRRIGSGIQPLAHGIPARVAKLRAIGNAIVPQVAAEFIKAVLAIGREL